MSMLAGADPSMAANGTVSGTANSLSLALGQAHAARFIAPAFAALDAAVADGFDASAAADQKAAIVEAWNDQQAPWLQDMAEAIISHITTYAEIVGTIPASDEQTGFSRLPNEFAPSLPGDETFGPISDKTIDCTIA